MALSLANSSASSSQVPIDTSDQHRIWHRFSKWLGRDDSLQFTDQSKSLSNITKPSFGRRLSRKVVPGLPRPATFRRQNSERRERLTPVHPSGAERRALSMDRRRARSVIGASSPAPFDLPQSSAPAVLSPEQSLPPPLPFNQNQPESNGATRNQNNRQPQRPAPPPSPPPEDEIQPLDDDFSDDDLDEQIKRELEEKWILNLSMHFRDRSLREKFFVTYAETPTNWRRVTVSCDYRDTRPDSLERDLQALPYQRDKSARIYESIRSSLPDIQFYTTVTNLRLQTSDDDRLHVHVTEDVNEIIPYPSTNAVKHLVYNGVSERDVFFDSHMSGFVYKVRVNNDAFNNKICVKKEIPGPDSVDEFLYEINALYSLRGTSNVIQFEGLVIDEENELVKGLLISYAEHGPLVDLVLDFKGTGELTIERREKWAWQIIKGLSEIHEAGFVQGDFTLSNIVIDRNDTAQIIDINRRGCPVGWEPPEIAKMIDSGQRISMYIGVKSDLFQLGMVLWALLMEEDEPERQQRPLELRRTGKASNIPEHLVQVTSICLSENPKDRKSAQSLLTCFPRAYPDSQLPPPSVNPDVTDRLTPAISPYSVPSSLLDLEHVGSYLPELSPSNDYSRNNVNQQPSFELASEDLNQDMVPERGRSPARNRSHLNSTSRYRTGQYGGHYEEIAQGQQPQIVPIRPPIETRDPDDDWNLVDSEEDEGEAEQRMLRREQRQERMRNLGGITISDIEGETGFIIPPMGHVDSGLADMDLVGIGCNELLLASHPSTKDMANDIDNLEDDEQTQSQTQTNQEITSTSMEINDPIFGNRSEFSSINGKHDGDMRAKRNFEQAFERSISGVTAMERNDDNDLGHGQNSTGS
jgi:serine/threonine protein kinase